MYFYVKASTSRRGEVEVGQAYLNLKKIVAESRDVIKAAVPVSGQDGASLGSLTVSLIALDALRSLETSAAALRSERLLARGTTSSSSEGAPGRHQASNASKFVGSFSSEMGGGRASASAASPSGGGTYRQQRPQPISPERETSRGEVATAVAVATSPARQPSLPSSAHGAMHTVIGAVHCAMST